MGLYWFFDSATAIVTAPDRFLKILSKGYIAGIIGAASAHVLADLVASLIDPSIRPMTVGIVIGGIIPLLFIPILEKYVIKSDDHIMVGDHEDIKKDLEQEHSWKKC